MAKESFLPLFGPDDTGIQREHKRDYRHRDRGAEKIIPDFLHTGTQAAEFQDPRCGFTANLKKFFPGPLLSFSGTVAITDAAFINRCIREAGIPCLSLCDCCLAGARRPDEEDFLGLENEPLRFTKIMRVHFLSCSLLEI
jgi:hypothetical protein